MNKDIVELQEGKYPAKFIMWLAMALYLRVVDNAEMKFWRNENWTVDEITKELAKRVRNAKD